MKIISSNQFGIGDVVRMVDNSGNSNTWSTTIVKSIRDGSAKLFRPYGTTSDFICGDSVICYIGIEEYDVPLDDHKCWELLEQRSKDLQ